MMSTSHSHGGGLRLGLGSKRGIAAFVAYALSLTTVVFGSLPTTPAVAAPGDADLAVTKVASSGSALLGTSIDFTVTVTNLGPGDTTGVAVTDVLPAEFTFQSASTTQGSYNDGSGIWSVGSMLLGSSQTLTITAEANSIAFVTNTATISASDEFDPVPGNNGSSAAVNIATVPPAVCETNDIIGIVGDTIYSIDTTTGVATPEFQTSFVTGNRNALASNRDLGIVYWGSAAVVYWWNPIDDTEGVLADLTGQINGTLESAGATYYQGHYYFSTEVSGNANGLYRIAIDPTSGTQVIPGSLELLAANQPEDGLEAEFNRDMRPDYGDLTVVTVNGDPLLFGSTVDGFDWPSYGGHWWSYNLNTGEFTFIAEEPAPNHVQLGTDLNGDTWGTDASGNLYAVNQATGEFVPTGLAVGFGLYDLSGSFCVPPELADIDLAKSMISNADEDGSSSVSLGDTLTYQFTVTNTGNSVLSNVAVTDPLIPGLSCSIGLLNAGATGTCTGAYQVVLADQLAGYVSNTATTVGTAPSGATVSDTASAIILVAQPEVIVTKTSDAAGLVVAGQTITYTVEVENIGVFDINALTISDPLPAATSYVDQSTLVDGWDAGTAAGSWSAEVGTDTTIPENCAAPLEFNFDMATAGEVADVEVGFAASHRRRGQLRALLTSPAGTTAVLMPGTSGDRDNNYDVLFDGDSTGPLDDGDADDVTPVDYERTVGAVSLETFVGEDGAGTWTLQVCDNNTQGALGTFRQATLFIAGVASNPTPMVKDNIPAGAQADLVDGVPPVLVTATDGFDLPMGESMTVTYQVQVDDQLDGSVLDIVNDVFVFSDELPTSTDYTIDPIDFLPELQIVKDGPVGPVTVGDLVTYTYTVDHTIDSDGSPVDVTLEDDIVDLAAATSSGDTDGDGLLDGGETWVFTVDYTIPPDAADPLVNVATVSGTDLNGEPIDDATDDHSVEIEFSPALAVEKVGAPDPAAVGDTITYTYTVSHDASSDRSEIGSVVVTDSRGLTLSGPAGDTDGDNLLDGDEVWVYTATETVTVITPDPLTNDVVVTGTDRDGDPVADATDSESIDIDWAPAIAVDKTGPATAAIGDTVTYTFTVTHGPASDGSPVTITSVDDDIAGGETYVSGDDGDGLLENGEAWVYEATYTVLATDPDPLVNVVTVTGSDEDGDPVADASDTHSTDIDHLPVLVITKTGPASALVGDTVTYDFSVGHDLGSDDTAVSGVTVADDVAGAAIYVSGDDGDGLLEAGEVWVFTATYTTQTSDPDPLVNTGTVTGFDEDGDLVTDSDTHSTDLIPTAAVGDLIWEDLDGDGTLDAGEPGLDGVAVALYDGSGTLIDTTITAGGGAYSFTDLAPGDYTIDVDESTLPFVGVLSTGNEPFSVTLTEGETNADADFGYFALALLGDFVWDDVDGDGIQDSGEPGIGGATVVAYAASDLTTPVATTSSFGDGSWSLSLVPGDYVIEFTLPAGYLFTTTDAGSDDTIDSDAAVATGLTAPVPITSGSVDTTIDAGAYVPAIVGDFVWNDLDGDGNQDGGELGLGGVTVRVFDASGIEIGSATTLADGSYSVAVAPGTYDVVIDVATLPAGFVLTTPATVGTGALVSGTTFADADFGAVVPTYPISGTVWNDEDVDATIGAAEPRLGGVSVELRDSGGGLIATAVTGADGSYDFPPVADGDYLVAVDETTVPVGMSLTTGNNPESVTVGGAAVAGVDFGYAFPGVVEITKDPATQQVAPGGSANFTITITNPGPQDLAGVVVTDANAPDCDRNVGSLASGTSVSYGCSLAGVTADFTNTAVVDAVDELGNAVTDSDDAFVDAIAPAIEISKTPDLSTVLPGADVTFTIRVENTGDVDLTAVVVTDALTPDCDASFATLTTGEVETYTCQASNVIADFTNVASVTGDDPLGDPINDSDDAVVDVINPAIEIEKTPDLQQVLVNGTAVFTITVTNTGDVELSDVAVSDVLAPACGADLGTLAAGAAATYICSTPNVAADFINVAVVAGDHAAGGLVTDSDDAVVDVIDPAIEIEKTPDLQQARDGDTVMFDITVTNTGDVELTDVTVTDPVAPNCAANLGTLAVGVSTTYSCSMTAGASDFTNTAFVTGDDPLGNPVADDDGADVDVINPAIGIEKTPDLQQARDGDTVTFDITVTNIGDVELTDVTVTDPVAPDCAANLGTLAVGASTTYSCTMTAGASDFTNTAFVSGDDPLGDPVADSDGALVDVINPAVEIEKTPDLQQARDGDLVTFDITVTNTGDVELTDVTVTDPVASDCDATLGSLAVGASTTYPCTMTAGAVDFTNTAFVMADDPLDNPVTDDDGADVDVINPAIQIEKTPDLQQARDGDVVTFDITVTNIGDIELTDVTVTDPTAPNCDANLGTLAVGASTNYSCSMTAGASDFTNTALVTGDDPLGNPVTDDDGADVDVIAPAIDIEKTPDLQQILPNGTATFSISVTNTGDVTLTDVTVSDTAAPDCDAVLATMTPGASQTYACTVAAGTSDFTNVADVTGNDPLGDPVTDSDDAFVDVVNPAISISKTPNTQQVLSSGTATFTITVANTGDVDLASVAVTDPLASDCDSTIGVLAAGASTNYTCSLGGVTADFTNTASVTGTHSAGGTVSASDTADVDVIAPSIAIEKTPDLQQARDGDTVTFGITVTNTGDVPLTVVTVTDALAPACDADLGTLAAGGSTTYSCTMTAGAVDFTNVANVTGDDPLGNAVTASDDADVDVIDPAIDIDKTPDSQQAHDGDTVTFDITVTNTGDVELTDVTVSDAVAPDCDADLGTLAAGASTTYNCTMTAGPVDFTNVANVTGNDPLGDAVAASDDADVDVISPAISISKTPDTQQTHAGDTVTFDITVTNTGDVPLTDVAVTDALAPACDADLGTLAAGGSVTYSCTMTAGPIDFTNRADVAGDDPLGLEVSASGDAVVDVINPAIDIQKTPDSQQAHDGDTVTFDITVTNTGDVELTDVTVSDAVAPSCDANLGALAAGASSTYSCSMTAGAVDFTNVADVTGDDPLGDPVTASDDADVDVISPAISISKTPDTQQAHAGDTVTFDITVTNTGDVPLTDVAVSDPVAPDCDADLGTLAAGAATTYSCSMIAGLVDFANVADVTGDDPLGDPVTVSDDADVDVINPALAINKTPDNQEAISGAIVTFDITVTNTGDVELTDVTVSDAVAPDCDADLGTLTAGAATTYSCSMTAGPLDFTNVADVTGNDPLGDPVTASDDADVDVVNPAIDIEKTPDFQQILNDGTATFTIAVSNIGDVPLDNVVVTDALAPDCDATYATLAAGAGDTYTCTVANVAADFTNVVVVTGEHPASPVPVTDTDDADVDVIAPAIDILKTTTTPVVVSGADVTFTITVENTGDSPLTNVVVTDLEAPGCDSTFAALAIGEVQSYTCTVTNVTADFTNIADVVADEPSGDTVADSDSAAVDVIAPAISIDKTPDTQATLPGGSATFTITVTNTGDVELSGVLVTDLLTPDCNRAFPVLGAGASETYSCTLPVVPGDFTNVASVMAFDSLGNPVRDEDSADVVIEDPAIEITKTAVTPTVVSGDDASFSITVTNIGTTPLTDVNVTDVLAPDCATMITNLAVGESSTYACTAVGVTTDFTNTAVVEATHPLSGTVSDSDTADVDVINPSVSISKNPASQQIRTGDPATFTITVENTGDVDLTGVVVTDLLSPTCDNTIGDLTSGSSITYSCGTTPADDFTNVATVAGFDPLGNTVTDSDDAVVDVINPAITVEKTPDSQVVVAGNSATFTISVTNSGDVDLTDVTVTDVVTPACDSVIGNLAAGATASYSCSAASVAADFTNTADVSGLDPLGAPVTDSDSATVDVIDPSVTLVKDPATQQILAGEDANFTITVTNTGDSPLTNVVVTDGQAPACDAVIPALGSGASATVTCAATGVASSFTNTASVVATHQAGGTVSDSDSAEVEVLVPLVDIQKTPNLQTIALNGTATFDITVTNAGVVPLSSVTVTDALAPSCDNTIGDIAVGAAVTYTCTLAIVTADFTNTAVVTATDAVGNPATDSDTADVDVVAPAVSIEKTPDTQAIVLNDSPVFDISVANTGDVDLTNVTITDPLAPACDTVIPLLVVGESTSYACSGTPTGGDFTNTASVVADSVVGQVTASDTADVTVLVPAIDIQKTPDTQLVGLGGTATFTITVTNAGATPLTDVAVSDPQAPNCDASFASMPVGAVESYACDVTGISGDFTNTASVTGDDPLGNAVTDSDTADVDFVDPAIDIEKTPDLQTLLAGEDASFTITVTNTGDTELTNVVVVDPAAPGCAATFVSLAIGASETVTCDVVAVAADFINTASVTADTPLGTQVSDSDDALVDVVSPGVEIQKTPDTQMVYNGDDVTFTITVANTGDQDLVDLTITDALTPACDTVIPALAVGESASYDCTAAAVTDDFTNIVAVDGVDVLGNPVSDSDDARVDVINPAIDIQKTPDTQAVVVNGEAVFDITVTNTGDVALDGVAVSDPLAPACDATIGALAVGATATYACSVSGVAADFTNTVSVTGIDPLGATVSDSDVADVTVLIPAVDIQKTPDLQQVRVGDPVDFTITVTNAGATELSNVTVTDPLVPACDAVIGALAVGESSSYTCTLPVSIDDFTNTAQVSADDPIGNPVTDSDVADVDVIAPAISISKSPDGQAIVVGGTATFTIEATNTGDVDLIDVTVTDVAVPACDNVIGALASGETASYACSVGSVTADFTNVADVVGTDPLGLVVTDSDTADVTVLVPGIDIQKTPDTQTIVADDDATFTIVVTNTGQTDLRNVVVRDPLVPACDNVIGTIPVGSPAVTYTCTAPVAASFTNTATVTAVDPIDTPISDSDTADVTALVRSNVAGTIAYDIAGDGAIDGADIGLGGIDVTATWAGLDGVFGTPDDAVLTTVTDGSGNYRFDLVPPGEYRIDVDTSDLPIGVDVQTRDPDAVLDSTTTLTLPEDTTVSDVDFAYTAIGSIGDLVFLDLDGDGAQDAGEPGLSGINVTVTWLGFDGVAGGGDDLVFSTTTLPNGSYEVDGLPAGEFTVVIGSVPSGLTGDLDQAVTLGAGEERDDVDFPLVGSGSIGDQVFEDVDHDGVFDGGEPGVAGVTVGVTWAGADGVIGTADDLVISTVTDGNGQYQVDQLPPGAYLIEVDESTIPSDLGTAAPISLTLAAGETNLTADFPLVGNRPPIAVDDEDVTDEGTPVTIAVLDDDSDPDGHSFAVSDTTDPDNGAIEVNPDGSITYTPDPGFVGVDTFTYTICETDGEVNGIPATGLCDTATVTVTIVDVNEPPGPDVSFQSVVVGDPVDPIPVFDSDGGVVTVTYVSGELPPGITLNPDGSFNGLTTEIGTYQVVVQVCDDDDPRICILHTHTIAVTPTTLPGPGDDPDPDDPPETLPFTGANLDDMWRAALVLLLAGAALVFLARRRRLASAVGDPMRSGRESSGT